MRLVFPPKMPETALPATRRFLAKREAILDSAALLFNQRGLLGGSLSDIAAQVGLVTSGVTYYYRKREDLAEACLLRAIDKLLLIVEAASAHATTSERIQAVFSGYLKLLAAIREGAHPHVMNLTDMRAMTGLHAERVFAAYAELARKVRKLLAASESSHLTKEELIARGFMLLSLVLRVRLSAAAYDPRDCQIVARRMSDLVVNGIASATAPWPIAHDEASFWKAFEGRPEISDPFLQVASRLVNEQGYHGASIERIAAELNLTKGAFYGKRESKNDLVADCFSRGFLVQRLAWEGAEAQSQGAWESLCIGLRSLLWFQVSSMGPMLRDTAINALPNRALQDSVRAAWRRGAQLLEDRLVEAMIEGSVRACAPSIAAQYLYYVIDTSAGLSRWEATANTGTIADLFLRPALFGILSPRV